MLRLQDHEFLHGAVRDRSHLYYIINVLVKEIVFRKKEISAREVLTLPD